MTFYSKWLELNPNDGISALTRAQLLLLLNRTDEYREACKGILEPFGQSGDMEGPDHVARACAIAPDAVPDPKRPVEIQTRVVSSYAAYWNIYTLGMAHLRAGELDEAAQRFHESLLTNPGWPARYLDWLGLALVHVERGETKAAREWLRKAVDMMEQTSTFDRDEFEACVLRREVEQLLSQPAPKSQDAESGKPG